MAVFFDFFNRHYKHRPVLYTTVLSRLVGFFSSLKKLYAKAEKDREDLIAKMNSTVSPTEETANALVEFCGDMQSAFVIIRQVVNDLDTMLDRDDSRIHRYYAELIRDLEMYSKHAKRQGKAYAKKLKSALEKEKESHGKFIKTGEAKDKKHKEWIEHIDKVMESARKESEHYHGHLHEICQKSYMESKYMDRGTTNPEGWVNELDFHRTVRLLNLEVYKSIEIDGLVKRQKRMMKQILKDEQAVLAAKDDLFKGLSKNLDKEMEDAERMEHRVFVIIHRFEHEFGLVKAAVPKDWEAMMVGRVMVQTKHRIDDSKMFIFGQLEKIRRDI